MGYMGYTYFVYIYTPLTEEGLYHEFIIVPNVHQVKPLMQQVKQVKQVLKH